MKALTDYPFELLGDKAGEEAPIRQITVISYDGDKYCKIRVEGINENIKRGYIYQMPKANELKIIPANDLPKLVEL